jgi:hypothetical protein
LLIWKPVDQWGFLCVGFPWLDLYPAIQPPRQNDGPCEAAPGSLKHATFAGSSYSISWKSRFDQKRESLTGPSPGGSAERGEYHRVSGPP